MNTTPIIPDANTRSFIALVNWAEAHEMRERLNRDEQSLNMTKVTNECIHICNRSGKFI